MPKREREKINRILNELVLYEKGFNNLSLATITFEKRLLNINLIFYGLNDFNSYCNEIPLQNLSDIEVKKIFKKNGGLLEFKISI